MFEVNAYAAMQAKESLKPLKIQRRTPGPNDVLIDIHYCGICHSDIHQARNEWGGGVYPMVPGHEIAGIVNKVGAAVKKFKEGDSVGVGCFVDSCRACTPCKEGTEQYCEQGMKATYNAPDGQQPTYGGYSKQIVVDENYVLKIPSNLPLDKAAPLLCAGITTYSPLRHWNVKANDRVGVIGLGGLGHMAVKIAAAMGAEVTVLSHSDKKKADALNFGAKNFVNTSQAEPFKKYANYFDFIINTVSSDIDLGQYANLLKHNATMVQVGAPEKPVALSVTPLIMQRRSLAGSLIGGIKETQEMLDFCGKHHITPEIELIAAEQINQAYERVLKSDVRYRFVIDIKNSL